MTHPLPLVSFSLRWRGVAGKSWVGWVGVKERVSYTGIL